MGSSQNLSVEVSVAKVHPSAVVPRYMTEWAAGCDVTACVETPIEVAPGARVRVPTGLSFAIPDGFEIQVRPRSGLASSFGLTVLNAPGTIDSDYRGEVQVLLVNLGKEPVKIASGERVAQLVLSQVPRAVFREVAELPASARGTGGFGSTGKQ